MKLCWLCSTFVNKYMCSSGSCGPADLRKQSSATHAIVLWRRLPWRRKGFLLIITNHLGVPHYWQMRVPRRMYLIRRRQMTALKPLLPKDTASPPVLALAKLGNLNLKRGSEESFVVLFALIYRGPQFFRQVSWQVLLESYIISI